MRRGIAAGSIVGASLSLFAGCVHDWDLGPLDSAPDDAAGDVNVVPVNDAGYDTYTPPPGNPDGCTTNADCNGGLCYFAASCGGGGTCIEATAPCNTGSVGAGVTGSRACGCANGADACAPMGATTQCTNVAGTSVACGFTTCQSASSFCEISEGGKRFECKLWTTAGCSSSNEHTCACAKKACDAGTCDATSGTVLTCP